MTPNYFILCCDKVGAILNPRFCNKVVTIDNHNQVTIKVVTTLLFLYEMYTVTKLLGVGTLG